MLLMTLSILVMLVMVRLDCMFPAVEECGAGRGSSLWLLYIPYEYLMYRRVLCSGECNIRARSSRDLSRIVVGHARGVGSGARGTVATSTIIPSHVREPSYCCWANGVALAAAPTGGSCATGALLSLIVQREGFGHLFGESFDPGLVSRMGREKLLRLFAVG